MKKLLILLLVLSGCSANYIVPLNLTCYGDTNRDGVVSLGESQAYSEYYLHNTGNPDLSVIDANNSGKIEGDEIFNMLTNKGKGKCVRFFYH